MFNMICHSVSSVQSLSHVRLFATPWTEARQASLSITNSWRLLKLMSIESVMPYNRFFLCRTLLLLPLIFPSIKVFTNESTLRIRWPKDWSFSISPSNEYPGLISFRFDAFELQCWRRLLRVPWSEKRSNQSVLKEINAEYSLEGLMLNLKL